MGDNNSNDTDNQMMQKKETLSIIENVDKVNNMKANNATDSVKSPVLTKNAEKMNSVKSKSSAQKSIITNTSKVTAKSFLSAKSRRTAKSKNSGKSKNSHKSQQTVKSKLIARRRNITAPVALPVAAHIFTSYDNQDIIFSNNAEDSDNQEKIDIENSEFNGIINFDVDDKSDSHVESDSESGLGRDLKIQLGLITESDSESKENSIKEEKDDAYSISDLSSESESGSGLAKIDIDSVSLTHSNKLRANQLLESIMNTNSDIYSKGFGFDRLSVIEKPKEVMIYATTINDKGRESGYNPYLDQNIERQSNVAMPGVPPGYMPPANNPNQAQQPVNSVTNLPPGSIIIVPANSAQAMLPQSTNVVYSSKARDAPIRIKCPYCHEETITTVSRTPDVFDVGQRADMELSLPLAKRIGMAYSTDTKTVLIDLMLKTI
ncbi:hypothetical protein BB561_005252 [Smittium simulii]|uniref:Uncharacterized protein n=1 Tax=Smittium simulii TaxID=133385 RepID=A0A2T9YBB6_9FUNG|nr:hypothetical protein BB561_005252 [Smittium simulii]